MNHLDRATELTQGEVWPNTLDLCPNDDPDTAFAEFVAELEQFNKKWSETVEKLANPVQVIDGDCKRCGHYGIVFYKRGTASYCWDCFVDKGHAKHYEYDDIMDELEVAK